MNNWRIINAVYVASAVKAEQFPAGDLPEVAFIGRSNVGKSSLLNSLSGRRRSLARISSAPGKTRTINFYQVTVKVEETGKREFFLVDLPGYGFAKASKADQQQWASFIQKYLGSSTRLKLVCLLVDIRHKPMASDLAAGQWLTDHKLPFIIVATKADKIGRMAVNKQLSEFKKTFVRAGSDVIAYSSLDGCGREELLARLAQDLQQ